MKEKTKLKTASLAMGSAIKAKLNKKAANQVTTSRVDEASVEMIVDSWGAMPKRAAEQTIEKYGLPNEAIPSRLIWYNNGFWKRTLVYRDEIPHNFPQPHTDMLENVINYKVPVDKFDELAAYDGSLYIDRTRGEASARCDMEAANILSLNMMHEIVTGRLSAQQAKKRQAEVESDFMLGRPAPLTERLQFPLPRKNTADPDRSNMTKPLMRRAGRKMKEQLNWKNALGVAAAVAVVALIARISPPLNT